MKSPPVLWSVNSELAYRINVKYYGDVHWVWCTTDFGSSVSRGNPLNNPLSAQVLPRYIELNEAAKSGDLHSSAISKNRMGLRQGVAVKYAEDVIDESQRDDINYIIENTECAGFRPLIYVIPYEEVKDIIYTVPVTSTANPSSTEYIIEKLPGHMFTCFCLERER